jgi:D-threo-aldose 1-dehydrogenase
VRVWLCCSVYRTGDRQALLERGPTRLVPTVGVKERGMGVVAATVYNSGLMITGAKPGAVCNYRAATPVELTRVAAIQQVCETHTVPLPAAALQFPLAHPVVASMVVGFSKGEEASQAMDWLDFPIPPAFWNELREKGLIDPLAPTPEQ